MKIERALWITNTVDYARGKDPSFLMLDRIDKNQYDEDDWEPLHTVTFEVDISREQFIDAALASLDKAQEQVNQEHSKKLDKIQGMRNDLLAITHKQAS